MTMRRRILNLLIFVLVCGAVYAVAVFARDRNGQTWLSRAAMHGRNQTVETLLKLGASVNMPGRDGNTPLHWAALYGHLETAELLLRHGADIDAVNASGRTPLYVATWHTSTEIVRALAESGADVNVPDKDGATALQWAAIAGHVKIMAILLEHGADVNVANREGRTALHYAAAILSGYPEPARVLLDHGAAVNVTDRLGNTPLHEAARARGYCALPKASVSSSHAGIRRDTAPPEAPPHSTALRGELATAKLLIEHGADINARDAEGQTPLAVAIATDNASVADFLRKHGGT